MLNYQRLLLHGNFMGFWSHGSAKTWSIFLGIQPEKMVWTHEKRKLTNKNTQIACKGWEWMVEVLSRWKGYWSEGSPRYRGQNEPVPRQTAIGTRIALRLWAAKKCGHTIQVILQDIFQTSVKSAPTPKIPVNCHKFFQNRGNQRQPRSNLHHPNNGPAIRWDPRPQTPCLPRPSDPMAPPPRRCWPRGHRNATSPPWCFGGWQSSSHIQSLLTIENDSNDHNNDTFWILLILFDTFWYFLILFDTFWYFLILFDTCFSSLVSEWQNSGSDQNSARKRWTKIPVFGVCRAHHGAGRGTRNSRPPRGPSGAVSASWPESRRRQPA